MPGLIKTGSMDAIKVAWNIASNFTMNALGGCTEESCTLFEKYDAEETGKSGRGGEYEVQTGFGWTNGVLVEFLNIYGDHILPSNHQTKLDLQTVSAPGFKTLKSVSLLPRNEENIRKTLLSLYIK